MLNLFNRCLRADYKLTENGGSYSIEVDGNTLLNVQGKKKVRDV